MEKVESWATPRQARSGRGLEVATWLGGVFMATACAICAAGWHASGHHVCGVASIGGAVTWLFMASCLVRDIREANGNA